MANIVVVDYHKGNLMSVKRGLEAAGASVFVSDDPAALAQADAAVLPGVGSFADASAFMRESGQLDALRAFVAQGKPFLGICLGMQLLFEYGEEGAGPEGPAEGLGIFKGTCRRLDARGLKVPHVGWNDIAKTPQAGPLFEGVPDGFHFYFTHSYAVDPAETDVVACRTEYGTVFPSAVARGAAFGCQFHPEKSSKLGHEVLGNFVRFVDACVQKGADR